MNRKSTLALAALAASLVSLPSLADHNSVWGAGWANMPNDIHNTRLEDNLSQDEWRTFVQKGAGADTVNRYPTNDRTSGSMSQMRMQAKPMTQTMTRSSGRR